MTDFKVGQWVETDDGDLYTVRSVEENGVFLGKNPQSLYSFERVKPLTLRDGDYCKT